MYYIKKEFLRQMCLCLALMMVATMPVVACSATSDVAEVEEIMGSGIYIKDPYSTRKISLPYETVQVDQVKEDQTLDYDRVLIDVSCLEKKANRVLREAYQDGRDILFVGDISVNDVRETLGIPVPEYSVESIRELNSVDDVVGSENTDNTVIDTSFFPSVGKKVSTDGKRTVITDIAVETAIPSEIAGAINAALTYDYLALASGTGGTARASSEWSIIDSVAREQYMTKCVVHTATELRKDPNNPSGSGEYDFYAWHASDVERRSNYFIHSVESEISGKSTSRIKEYGPENTTAPDISITIGLPWGVQITYPTQCYTKITKTSGGLARSSVRVQFLAASPTGASRPDTALDTRVSARFYQGDNYFNAIGCSYITVCDTQSGDNPTTYRTNSDILTGS